MDGPQGDPQMTILWSHWQRSSHIWPAILNLSKTTFLGNMQTAFLVWSGDKKAWEENDKWSRNCCCSCFLFDFSYSREQPRKKWLTSWKRFTLYLAVYNSTTHTARLVTFLRNLSWKFSIYFRIVHFKETFDILQWRQSRICSFFLFPLMDWCLHRRTDGDNGGFMVPNSGAAKSRVAPNGSIRAQECWT